MHDSYYAIPIPDRIIIQEELLVVYWLPGLLTPKRGHWYY